MDLGEKCGQPCHLEVGGRPAQVLCLKRVEGIEIQDADASQAPRSTGCFAALVRGGGSPFRTLLYEDLLGAEVDGAAGQVRLVHCPPARGVQGAPRSREDVVLRLGEAPLAAALAPAQAWATEASKCSLTWTGTRHFLVFVNPAAGSGRAPRAWAEADELWKAVPGLSYTVVTTSRAQEAYDHVKAMDLKTQDAIVIVSGDGVVHEVLNGLATRPDAQRALLLPIGHIPGGSGNGLAKSVLATCGEHCGVLEAAFAIAKGRIRPIDLMSVQATNNQRVSFLGLSAATISDIDIESERLRCLGGARFTVWGVWRVIRPVLLRAEFMYWPAEEAGDLPPEPLLDAELGPGPWQRLRDNFAILWGCNTAWQATDALPCPDAELADGLWHVFVLRGAHATKLTMLRGLLGLDSGAHVALEGVEILRCRAFRLTPQPGEGGHLSVDGEVVPFGPVQVWPKTVKGRVLGGA